MEYRGRVQGGVVLFEAAPPPDGAKVRVEVVEEPAPPVDRNEPTIWQKLRKFAGAVKGLPPDMARNHDHYIHGGPKR
jgi:hypothetical protein